MTAFEPATSWPSKVFVHDVRGPHDPTANPEMVLAIITLQGVLAELVIDRAGIDYLEDYRITTDDFTEGVINITLYRWEGGKYTFRGFTCTYDQVEDRDIAAWADGVFEELTANLRRT